MIKSRNGKIARLPSQIRDKLNLGIENGMQGRALVDWLNSLPEVRNILASQFDGKPIREQNLSEWRKGGYQEWFVHQESLAAVRRVNSEMFAILPHAGDLAENAALWLTARYLAAAQEMVDEDGRLDWKILRELCNSLVALRRGNHSNQRILAANKRHTLQERCANVWAKRNIDSGMKSLMVFVEKHPKAKAAFDALAKEVRPYLDDPLDADTPAANPDEFPFIFGPQGPPNSP